MAAPRGRDPGVAAADGRGEGAMHPPGQPAPPLGDCEVRGEVLAGDEMIADRLIIETCFFAERNDELLAEAIDKFKQNYTNMENLLNCDGRKFKATIKGIQCEGEVSVVDGCVFLCQNKVEGASCSDKRGYKFSWKVATGSSDELSFNGVGMFSLPPRTASEIAEYKDFQVGDKISKGDCTWNVIFRSGKLLVCENEGGNATHNYTCDELYNSGWRLVAEPEPEDDSIVELTIEEIAEKFGINPDKIRIKKQEE